MSSGVKMAVLGDDFCARGDRQSSSIALGFGIARPGVSQLSNQGVI